MLSLSPLASRLPASAPIGIAIESRRWSGIWAELTVGWA